MVYLIILALAVFLVSFALDLFAFYFLIKFFNKTTGFLSILKPILWYEVGVFCFFFVNPTALVYAFKSFISSRYLPIIDILITIVVLFLIFSFVMKKFTLLNFRKSLIVFLIMFLVITPVIFYTGQMIESSIAIRFPIFSYGQQINLNTGLSQLLYPQVQPLTFSQILFNGINSLNHIFLESSFLYQLFVFTIIR